VFWLVGPIAHTTAKLLTGSGHVVALNAIAAATENFLDLDSEGYS